MSQEETKSNIIFYQTDDGDSRIDVRFEDETIWLTQAQIAELFGVNVPAISKHINNIYEEEELESDSTLSKMETVRKEGQRQVKRELEYYNLDMIISIGYRVNSHIATQFRRWATKTLREYIIKGFVMDDERLKNGSKFGKDYFDELLERIRLIRASERRFYKKITDIYAECSIDYDSSSETTKVFYATVQNKLHWAIHGHTAAELISERADASKTNMGLTTWKNSPKGKILKSDVSIAKNYLNEEELDELNLIVNMYLDYAELQAKKQVPMKMVDWAQKLDGFLQFNDYEALKDAGKVSTEVAKQLAEDEYEKYKPIQDAKYISDFDEVINKYIN